MFSYITYGLNLRSDLPFPELFPGGTGEDVVISLERADRIRPLMLHSTSPGVCAAPDEALMQPTDAGVFRIKSGREIHVTPVPGVEHRVLRTYLLGIVMAMLLYQRGRLVLHASAVAIAGNVVGFIAESGGGKSSMAAALYARGHRLIADDLVPIEQGTGSARTYPGFPQIKLHPEAAVTIGYTPDTMAPLHPLEEKLGYRIADNFATGALPVSALYILNVGVDRRIERLSHQEAFSELIRHSYPTRLGISGSAEHLHQYAQLTREVPIYRLSRPFSLPSLPGLARFVEDHCEAVFQ